MATGPWRHTNHANVNKNLIQPGIEPGTARVLGERDNQYTTEPWLFSVEDGCRPIPIIDHASVVSALSVHIGSVVTFRCDKGYYFENGLQYEDITCEQDGEWSPIGQCTGNRNYCET